MKNQTKTFTNENALFFSNIEIKKEILRKTYLAYFECGKTQDKLSGCAIRGNNLEDCVRKVSEHLNCEIDERHYIIK